MAARPPLPAGNWVSTDIAVRVEGPDQGAVERDLWDIWGTYTEVTRHPTERSASANRTSV